MIIAYTVTPEQIIRPSGVDLGVLLRKVVDDKSSDWIVSVEGNEVEEHVSERNLILARRHVTYESKDASPGGAANVSEDDKVMVATTKATAKASKKGVNGCPKIVNNNNKSSNNDNNKSSNKDLGARNTRTTRRQRGDDSELFVGDIEKIEKVKKPPKRPREAVSGPHETVVKVKMLTGTVSIKYSNIQNLIDAQKQSTVLTPPFVMNSSISCL